MYNIKLENYVPKPMPAKSDRIVAAHYYAAWKFGSAEIHNGFDDLHSFPERTPLMGYYDEENPKVTDYEIKWALEHGINCFIYCWYRRKENEGKKVTMESLRCPHAIHEALFKAKYGEMMNFAIMYENFPRWGGTDKRDILENLMPFWTENYFKRDNYLKIDGCPVLFVCDKNRLDSSFSNAEEETETFEKMREYARREGFSGLMIAACIWDHTEVDSEDYINTVTRGYDFHFSYNSGYYPEKSYPPEEEVTRGQCEMLKKRLAPDPMRHVPTVSCFQDPTPRTTDAWKKLGYKFDEQPVFYLSPDGFRETIREMKSITDTLPEGAIGRKIFMIDNWNEWDEGHFVSPSHAFGFRYLEAIREELTERNNLPDYRTPQDVGISDLNRSWKEPDLGPVCKKKFKFDF